MKKSFCSKQNVKHTYADKSLLLIYIIQNYVIYKFMSHIVYFKNYTYLNIHIHMSVHVILMSYLVLVSISIRFVEIATAVDSEN